jgi:hypothetical protein
MGEHGQGFGRAVVVVQGRQIRLARLTLADHQEGGFGNGPAPRPVADRFARRAQFFAPGLLGAFHQATRGDEILHPGKPTNVVALIEEDRR